MDKQPPRNGLPITLGLLVISWGITVWLFHYLTNPVTRSGTFGFTLAYVCFLELLFFGYFAALFIPRFRKSTVWAIYPTIGIIVASYLVVSLGTVIVYNLLSVVIASPKGYFAALAVESVLFVMVLGVVVVLNAHKKAEDSAVQKERSELVNLAVAVQEIYQSFTNCREFLDIESYRDVEQDIRKLKEKFQFCTPFTRSNGEVAQLEKQIHEHIETLWKAVGELGTKNDGERNTVLQRIRNATHISLQAMERRERLLIK